MLEDREFHHAIVTAFGEAFNNIVIHGYAGRTDGILWIDAELGEDRITLRLRDQGRRIDFRRAARPQLDDLPERGLGMFIIYSLVDFVSYVPGDVNVLSLTKTVRTGKPDQDPRDEEAGSP